MDNEIKNKGKILYLSYDGLTDPLGESQILPYIAGLSREGYDFTIISLEKPRRFKLKRNKIASFCSQAGINWDPLPFYKHPFLLSTLFNILFIWRKARKLYIKKKFRAVICRSYLVSLAGLQLKRKFGIKFIFDMRGFWLDERVEGHLWNLKNPVLKLIFQYLKMKEKQFTREADHIVTLTESARSEILAREPGSGINSRFSEMVSVIPTCVDTLIFDPSLIRRESQDELRHFLGILTEEHVLCYLGSLGTWYLLDEMLDFYNCLTRKIPISSFMVISPDRNLLIKSSSLSDWELVRSSTETNDVRTTSDQKKTVEGRLLDKSDILNLSIYVNRNLPGHRILNFETSRNLIPLCLSLCHESIAFIKPTFSKKGSSATKIGEVLSMGKPVIVNKGWGDIEKLINSHNGYLINNFDRPTYDKTIAEILDDNKKDTYSIRSSALNFLSLESGIENYARILNGLYVQNLETIEKRKGINNQDSI